MTDRPALLIIDDDVSLARAFARLLEREGFVVTMAHSGLEGLVALRQRAFQAILCDLRLPFLEGRLFYKELVDQYPDQAARVLFITGQPPDADTEAFVAETGRPILHKPVEFTDLLAAVRRTTRQG